MNCLRPDCQPDLTEEDAIYDLRAIPALFSDLHLARPAVRDRFRIEQSGRAHSLECSDRQRFGSQKRQLSIIIRGALSAIWKTLSREPVQTINFWIEDPSEVHKKRMKKILRQSRSSRIV